MISDKHLKMIKCSNPCCNDYEEREKKHVLGHA